MSARDVVSGELRFDGETIEPALDNARLSRQIDRVKALMQDGQWRTLREIQAIAGGTEQGISARLRDLKKIRFGAYRVTKRRRDPPTAGVFEYRVSFNRPGEEGA